MRNFKWTVHNALYLLKYYRPWGREEDLPHGLVFIFDPHRNHPGLLDRLKGVVGSYGIAIENNLDFKILFEPGSSIPNYIEPNKINWKISPSEISHNIFHIRLTNYYGKGDVQQLKNKTGQYHLYNYVGHDLRMSNGVKNNHELWTRDYNALFRPTKMLNSCLEEFPHKPNQYIAVHVRFVNALELQETRYSQRPLCENERLQLMDDCIRSIMILAEQEKSPALVFSDSNIFLEECRKRGVNTLEGNVGHISYHSSEDVVRKALVDLYMISRAKAVYQLNCEHLYKSAFSYYGALIGGKECKRVEINKLING
ncbi:hypothetical protein [Xylanibacter ruminicola]|uniref:hypothetical protein n=1 Tax=Xylanibacter ruminicola TaxID=839 RepID=UPI00048D03F0|nr:hypothetical protein [Xylanibacter ruminicola]